VLLGLLPAGIAARKGYSFRAWWFFGTAVFVVALPAAIAIELHPHPAGPTSRRCPFCATVLREGVVVCRRCGWDIPPLDNVVEQSP
jgi:hypothetical protein